MYPILIKILSVALLITYSNVLAMDGGGREPRNNINISEWVDTCFKQLIEYNAEIGKTDHYSHAIISDQGLFKAVVAFEKMLRRSFFLKFQKGKFFPF